MLNLQFISHQVGTSDINVGVVDDQTEMTGVQKCSSPAVLAAIDVLTATLADELNAGLARTLGTQAAAKSAAVTVAPVIT